MSERIIKTTILLRNDTEENWLSANPVLSAGEAGVIRKEDGTVKLVVGDGETELSGLEYIGGDAAQHFEVSAFEELADIEVVHGGDTAVVKEEIANGKYSYTAYVYDAELTAWKAMDGNYSASNVYFENDITAMYAFGKLSGTTTNPKTISAAGKSIETLFTEALTEVKNPGAATAPTIAISGLNTTITAEVGQVAYSSIPTINLTFEDGKYTYGPEPTGALVSAYTISCNNPQWTTKTWTKSETDNLLSNGILSTFSAVNLSTATTDGRIIALDNTVSIKLSANAKYTNGFVAYNNLKQPANVAAANISADTAKTTATITVTGYYPAWYGFSTNPVANSTFETVISANNADTIKINNNLTLTRVPKFTGSDSLTKTFKSTTGWYELFYLVPKAKYSTTSWSGTDTGTGLPVAVESSTTATVKFPVDSLSAVTYTVFVVRNSGKTDATTCEMKF
jgi:hypothetical protein